MSYYTPNKRPGLSEVQNEKDLEVVYYCLGLIDGVLGRSYELWSYEDEIAGQRASDGSEMRVQVDEERSQWREGDCCK